MLKTATLRLGQIDKEKFLMLIDLVG